MRLKFKLVLLGATGGTGECLLEQALRENHAVTAIVRNPDKVTVKHDNLKVDTSNIFSEDELTVAFKDCDAVMSCLGGNASVLKFWRQDTFYEDTIKVIVNAMRKAEVDRLVCVTAAGAKGDPRLPKTWKYILKPMLSRGYLNSMANMENYLSTECQDINFTVVKPPGLTDNPLKDTTHFAVEEEWIAEGTSIKLPRANLAKFMLECLQTQEWDRKLIAVSIKD